MVVIPSRRTPSPPFPEMIWNVPKPPILVTRAGRHVDPVARIAQISVERGVQADDVVSNGVLISRDRDANPAHFRR